MNKQHDYYQARAALQREMAAELTGSAREQHLTLAAMYEALATEPKRGAVAELPAKVAEPEVAEDERAYLQRRAREERARAADSDDPGVRRIRFEMADEYLRRADALKRG
ncbi:MULTISPECIES: hypothetical protein [Sphingomonas]|jgi:hypothetical protein|uniref:Uncharacterized protein n=1 Tax=Sphingomonas leidyi TaxID=68569 RepID=A0A7X5ZU78_9SPHN|nr:MULTISPECIES: hypothetical protein [Sphingomonas]MBN8811731.1 hypothetical protein [Sphingomonas sp.]NIJ63735.1 hypothetical protein [Sphingomonas leidyi]OJY52707.1 MAG: hypothetical protein BGP17_14185 [Sphingomonas sp. 67-41]